jgi:hypothetical protein
VVCDPQCLVNPGGVEAEEIGDRDEVAALVIGDGSVDRGEHGECLKVLLVKLSHVDAIEADSLSDGHERVRLIV